MTVVPSCLRNCSANRRAALSTPPPATNGTMTLTILPGSGKAAGALDEAMLAMGKAASAPSKAPSTGPFSRVRVFMLCLLFLLKMGRPLRGSARVLIRRAPPVPAHQHAQRVVQGLGIQPPRDEDDARAPVGTRPAGQRLRRGEKGLPPMDDQGLGRGLPPGPDAFDAQQGIPPPGPDPGHPFPETLPGPGA